MISAGQTPIQMFKTPEPKNIPDEANLGFGKHFTDHMLMATYREEKGWHDARICPYGHFDISPASAVLHYSQCLFEGLKAYNLDNGDIATFRPEFNWKRMTKGSERLCMPMVSKDLFLDGIKELVKTDRHWIPKSADGSLYIRPTLIATESFLGIRPSKEFIFFIIMSPVGAYYGKTLSPVKIWIETQYSRTSPGGLGDTKAGANYAASIKAAEEAKEKGYNQVLWLDVTKKNIEEVGTMNVFFVIGDEIVSPQLSGSILEGKIRNSAITLLKDEGYKVSERTLSLEEVKQASKSGDLKEIFGTGTAAVISPVGELGNEDTSITVNENKVGEITSWLHKKLTGIQYGRSSDPYTWVTTLS